jgi:hypothetical protein
MESQHTPARALTKLLAIVGFFTVLALIIWGLVQGVRAFPSAFLSLASIAETINSYKPNAEFSITPEKNIVNSGELFTLAWSDMGDGEYRFSYACEDSLIVSVRTEHGAFQPVSCMSEATFSKNVHSLVVSVVSLTERYSDVALEVSFEGENGDTHTDEYTVTVVNAAVSQNIAIGTTTIDVAPVEEAPVSEVPTTTPVIPTTPAPVTPTIPETTLITYYPTSQPNGFTDLEITYLGVGTIENGDFKPKATFDEDDRAAFRFEVKNIGTKTADTWTYALSLPGGATHTSKNQTALLPNERVIFTVGFDLISSNDKTVVIAAEVASRSDKNTKNDAFSWSVKVVD